MCGIGGAGPRPLAYGYAKCGRQYRGLHHGLRIIWPSLPVFPAVGGADLADNGRTLFLLHPGGRCALANPNGDARIGNGFLVPASLLSFDRTNVDAIRGRHDPDGGATKRGLRVATGLDVDFVAFRELPDKVVRCPGHGSESRLRSDSRAE